MMRRIRTIAIILCISLLLPFMFTSCGKTPKTADELIERVEAAMDAVGSYEQDIRMDIEVWVSGTKMVLEALGTGILIDTADDYYYYNKMNMEMTVGDAKTPEKSASLEIYDSGKAYFLNDENGKVNKQYTEVSAEEYKAYLEEKGAVDDYIYNCETKEFSKNEDEEWEIVLTDYTDEALSGIYDKAGLGMLFDADAIKDIKTEVLVDEDFRVLEYEIEFRFNEDGEGNKPSVRLESEFSEYGEGIRENFTGDDYKKIKNFLDAKRLEKVLDTVITYEDASATLNVEQIITHDQKKIYNSKETDTIKYGIRDGKFFYDLSADANGQNVKMKYADGKQSVTSNGQTKTTNSTELVAKATLGKILDCTGYALEEIKSFENKGNGVYEVELNKKEAEAYANVFGTGTELYSAILKATYTVKDGKLVSIRANGEIKGKGLYALNITISLVFG